jgi:glycerophosphoryl diester phosphodiesterase
MKKDNSFKKYMINKKTLFLVLISSIVLLQSCQVDQFDQSEYRKKNGGETVEVFWFSKDTLEFRDSFSKVKLVDSDEVPFSILTGQITLIYKFSGGTCPKISMYDRDSSSVEGYSPIIEKELEFSETRKSVTFSFFDPVGKLNVEFSNLTDRGLLTIFEYKIEGWGIVHGLDNSIEFTDEYVKDKTRFIAHAGGEIDGYKYSNSKDALDLNYSKGFRMFELDVITTLDNKLVAAHDWPHWADITGYDGVLPPTEAEFLKHKIFQQYTPIGMEGINEWFLEHQDAILVTDKINEPKRFISEFTFRDRLIMELFTTNAIDEAKNLQFHSVVASSSVWGALQSDKLQYLLDNKINYLGISRTAIHNNLGLIKKAEYYGVKTYAWHINFGVGNDENYVLNHEIGMVHGMYADKWEF